jgi:mono/diheme cytochrome c family protein
LVAGIAVFAASACSRPTGASRAALAQAPDPKPASNVAPRTLVRDAAAPHAGSPVVLADLDGRRYAFVADEDDQDVHIVETATSREVGLIALSGVPSQLLVLPDGRLVVLLRDQNRLETYVPEPLAQPAGGAGPIGFVRERSVATPAEPVGVAFVPSTATLLVTCGFGASLVAIDAARMEPRFVVPLPREPRAVVVRADDARAFVSHAVGGRVSVVDLATRAVHDVRLDELRPDGSGNEDLREGLADLLPQKRGARSVRPPAKPLAPPRASSPRVGCQGFALAARGPTLASNAEPLGRVFAPQVLVDVGDTRESSSGYGSGFVNAEVTDVAVLDASKLSVIPASVTVRAQHLRRAKSGCLLPRAAHVVGDSLFVTCLGVDTVVEYDANASNPEANERRRIPVAAGPVGMAHDSAANRLVVWSQFDKVLSFLALDTLPEVRAENEPPRPAGEPTPSEEGTSIVRVALSRKASGPMDADLALGRKLFHAASDHRISFDGRACASCHPDGRDDALTWSTPDGPRQTPMLAGRLQGTAPFGWTGDSATVDTHLIQTFRRLRGSGFHGEDRKALLAYVRAMEPPPHASEDASRIARGRAVFEAAETGCASCHTGALASDGKPHDVQSRTTADRVDAFDTPSLRFVGGTAPYFHDGRYATLRELLVGIDGRMGNTGHLTPQELDDLEAYLRSL